MGKALEKLSAESGLPALEKKLDRRLSRMARSAYCELTQADRPQSFDLFSQAEQAHADELDDDEDWVGTKPDFTWRMQDDLARTPQELTKDFHIESKRLGRPTSRKWILTKQYVANGITRFLSADHRYGHDVTSGAMIGYVQDSEPPDLVGEVNGYIAATKDYAIPPLEFPRNGSSGWAVTKTRQPLNRSEVSPADFVLHHLWVDLRGRGQAARA
jgi:hypothetical protein